MRVLIINPIPYTSETRMIQRAASIEDTMIYDLCLAFQQEGHEVVLWAAEPYKPYNDEKYPFEVLWGKCVLKKIFMPHRFPVMPELHRYLRKSRKQIDLIISSEVFSLNSLIAYWIAPQKTIIWHELAKHNAMMKKIPSRVWYGFIARVFLRKAKVIARSVEARNFISQYCKNVDHNVIDHGVNLSKFRVAETKENYFVVCSQLIERKRIDGIIRIFTRYQQQYDPESKLVIIGDGTKSDELKAFASKSDSRDSIVFMGRMAHEELMPILATAKAMLVNTVKDNSMISIVEAIAVGTPVVTTDVPLNASYVQAHQLGIVKHSWTADDLYEIVNDNVQYAKNCIEYRSQLSTKTRVKQFLALDISLGDPGKLG